MKRILAFLLLLLNAALCIAQDGAGGTTTDKCGWSATAGGSGAKYLTPQGACTALIGAMAPVNKPDGGTTKWQFTKAEKRKDGMNPDYQYYDCWGVLPGIFDEDQAVGQVYSQCTKDPEEACKTTKDQKISRIFQWLDSRSDPYDIYKAPEYISVESCEYKRTKKVVIAEKRKICKYSATIEYVGTGESRTNPTFNNVAEKCDGDEEGPEDPDEVNPGAFPTIRDLYEPEYPDGISGVLSDLTGKLKATPFVALIGKLLPQLSAPGVCDSWNFDFNFGAFMNLGQHSLTIDCNLFTALKAIVVMCALFAARRIIFGG